MANLWAIILAVVAAQIIGFAWYSPVVLGKPWMKSVGWSKKEIAKRKDMGNSAYVVSVVASLLAAIILAYLITATGVSTMAQGLTIGLLVWLGFSLTTISVIVFFEQKNKVWLAVHASYWLVSFLAMSAIITAWP